MCAYACIYIMYMYQIHLLDFRLNILIDYNFLKKKGFHNYFKMKILSFYLFNITNTTFYLN